MRKPTLLKSKHTLKSILLSGHCEPDAKCLFIQKRFCLNTTCESFGKTRTVQKTKVRLKRYSLSVYGPISASSCKTLRVPSIRTQSERRTVLQWTLFVRPECLFCESLVLLDRPCAPGNCAGPVSCWRCSP